jgi:farnesyl diphosphate synthase
VRRLQEALAADAAAVEAALAVLLPGRVGPESRLFEAMRYAALDGGKRMRPFLVLESARLFAVNPACAMRVACAVEMVHCYSLVHDDLPAMDDDDLRRGRPTVHRKFDEATAILAGDGLLTAAFSVLADPLTHADPLVRSDLVRGLADAAGPDGMVAGQMIDLVAEHDVLDIGAVTRLQRLKTGALICFAAEAGAILGKAAPSVRAALHGFAQVLGLAFQMTDDLLDAEGATGMGKRTGKDAERGKATFVSLMGVERAQAQVRMLADQAPAHLDLFGKKADLLRELARWAVDRRN